jgi:hypothetical protein
LVSDLHIVGIHGIRQGATTAERLTAEWGKSLAKGLSKLPEPRMEPPALTVPHYSHLFYSDGPERLGSADGDGGPGTWTAEKEEFVWQALLDELPGFQADQAQDVEVLGLPWVPPRIAKLLPAVDARYGQRGAGEKIMEQLEEVHGYLHEPDQAARVRDRVGEALRRPGTRAVIAHSLGSVIVYDMLQRGEITTGKTNAGGVTTLITCGSPLAWPSIRRGLGAADTPLKVPAGLSWTNVYATGDIVTGGAGLKQIAPQAVDRKAFTGIADPHAAVNYLSTKAVAEAVRSLSADA